MECQNTEQFQEKGQIWSAFNNINIIIIAYKMLNN